LDNKNGILFMSLISKEQSKVNSFSERLKILMENYSFKDFADKTGLKRATLNNYANNLTSPTLEKLAMIADATDTSIEWLVSGELPDETMLTVYQYDFKASAGFGSLVVSENPVAQFKISLDWLTRQGIRENNLCVVEVQGDSMEPTLEEGDLMLVAMSNDKSSFKDGINVIRINGEMYVKRLQKDFVSDAIEVKSDNKEYETKVIAPDFNGDFEIIGRLLRVLQRARG